MSTAPQRQKSRVLPSIALVGRAGVGKSTLAGALAAHGYYRFAWADAVKAVAEMAYGPVDKDAVYTVAGDGRQWPLTGRALLQRLGTDAIREQLDEDFWIKAGLRRLAALEALADLAWVNDDTRFANEVAALRGRGFVVVRLVCRKQERMRRLRIGESALALQDAHPSEYLSDRLDVDTEIDTTHERPDALAEALVAGAPYIERRTA